MAYQQRDLIPQGWRECPAMGDPFFRFIPMKVPIANPSHLKLLQSHEYFTPRQALDMATERIQLRPEWALMPDGQTHMMVGAVLDLSNSRRYYDPQEFRALNVYHIKVPCRGRGQSPDPAAVNAAIWELRKIYENMPQLYVLVHCTHGFNRTGYIIVNALMRFFAAEGMSVERALRRFAMQRPPGIYKDDYIQDLFRYHHERRPPSIPPVVPPDWKGPSSPPDVEEEQEMAERAAARQAEEMAPKEHDDIIGEQIAKEEEAYIQQAVSDAVLWQSDMNVGRNMEVRFPGSQPVSLDRQNMSLIQQKRYYMTWKADGTRYMVLITHFGVYLVDRSNRVRRLQMRFPTALPDEKRKGAPHPVGPPHAFTLLDGEMVVDTEADGRQRRRYLVYDIMLLNRLGVGLMRFEDRFALIHREVEKPRRMEGEWVVHTAAKHPAHPFLYEYDREPFSVRRKDFWPLTQAEKVLQRFIPKLCHESDGLILQSWDDPYEPRTCQTLLKWKFAHLNSVDFKLVPPGPGQAEPGLLLMHKGEQDLRLLKDARITFPPGTNPAAYYHRIVECTWDAASSSWRFLRDRVDKQTPNHINTYRKVWGSIQDDIQDSDVLQAFHEALKMAQYAPDVMPQQHQQPHHHQAHPQHHPAGYQQPLQQHPGHAPLHHQHAGQHSHPVPHHHHQQPPAHHQQQAQQLAGPGPGSLAANGMNHASNGARVLSSPPRRVLPPMPPGSHDGAEHTGEDDGEAGEQEVWQEEGQEQHEEEEDAPAGSSPGSQLADGDEASEGLDGADGVEEDYRVTEAVSEEEDA